MIRYFFLITIIFLASCKANNPEISQKSSLLNRIADYYSIDSAYLSNITLSDSVYISTVLFKGYYFYDKSCKGKIRSGYVLIDLTTGNIYMHSTPHKKFDPCQQDPQKKIDSSYLSNHFSKFFLTKYNNSFSAGLEDKYKLESLLNNMRVDYRLRINRAILDSIFRFTLFHYEFTQLNSLELINDIDKFNMIIDNRLRSLNSLKLNNSEINYLDYELSNLKLYVNDNINKGAFLYTLDGLYYLVTVNRNFKDLKMSQEFFTDFTNENQEYTIELYFLGNEKIFVPPLAQVCSKANVRRTCAISV